MSGGHFIQTDVQRYWPRPSLALRVLTWCAAFFAGSLAFFLLFVFFESHDAALMQAVSRYEACVKREYGMTPIAWYEQHGKYPECGPRPAAQ